MKAAGRKPQAYALQGKRRSVFGLDLQATDVFVLAWLILISILAVLFHSRIKDPWRLVLNNTVCGFLYLGAISLHRRASHRGLRFLIRVASVQLIIFHLFITALSLQLIIWRSWQDQIVLDLEQAVFGVQPTVHCLTDVVIGILAAWFVLRIVPSLMRGWNAWLDRRFRKNA
jgi:hypothetical protein